MKIFKLNNNVLNLIFFKNNNKISQIIVFNKKNKYKFNKIKIKMIIQTFKNNKLI